MRRIAPVLALVLIVCGPGAQGARFDRSHEPIRWVDDTAEIEKPQPRGWNRYHGFIDGYWTRPLDDILGIRCSSPAADINALEEVPASSWFAPRAGHARVPPRDIEPTWGISPLEWNAPLRVVSARVSGLEPFLEILEPDGRRVILEFDHPDHPEVRTAAAVVASRLLDAAGYNVLECFIDEVSPEQLAPTPDARKIGEWGGESDLGAEDLQAFLANLSPDGTPLRCAVHRFPRKGVPIGGFSDTGTRKDDPNDRIPHERRRSLRGLRVVASWLDMIYIRPDRTLDVYLTSDKYVRHCLAGTGLCLGAQVPEPNPLGCSRLDPHGAFFDWTKTLLEPCGGTTAQRPEPTEVFRGVGMLYARGFEPLDWQPAYPFAPFERMTWADGLWGARLVASLGENQIRAAVDEAHLSDEGARVYVTGALTERRDRIATAWFSTVNAADGFLITSPAPGRALLTFEDLGVSRGYKQPEDVLYAMKFMLPELSETAGIQSRGGDHLAFNLAPFLPSAWIHRDDPRRYGCARIFAYDHRGHRLRGETAVHIYFDPSEGPRIIGIERR